MTTPLAARVLLADDHTLVRRGLRLVLDAAPDLDVVAEADDGHAALEAALQTQVDLAVLDVSMPRLTGLQVARELRAHRPDVRVLLLSMHETEQHLRAAVLAGARGYVHKGAVDQEFIEGCRAVLRGAPFVFPGSTPESVRQRVLDAREGEDGSPLTPREEQVLKLVAEGHTSKEIAELLVISERTVERHRENILDKIDVRDRVDLTRYAIRAGLVDP